MSMVSQIFKTEVIAYGGKLKPWWREWTPEYRAWKKGMSQGGKGKGKVYQPQGGYQPQGCLAIQDCNANWNWQAGGQRSWEAQVSNTDQQWSQQPETAASASNVPVPPSVAPTELDSPTESLTTTVEFSGEEGSIWETID
jgi:hypothetical protein